MINSDFWESRLKLFEIRETRREFQWPHACSVDLTKAAMTYRGHEIFVGFFIDTWKLNPVKTNSCRKIHSFYLYRWISKILVENCVTKTIIWLPFVTFKYWYRSWNPWQKFLPVIKSEIQIPAKLEKSKIREIFMSHSKLSFKIKTDGLLCC